MAGVFVTVTAGAGVVMTRAFHSMTVCVTVGAAAG